MLAATTLRALSFDRAVALVDEGAAFVDLRPIAAYLEVHVPGSIPLVYEAGPGMAGRARDCIPLSQDLILLADETAHMGNAAAALRGKGFPVLGQVEDAINAWAAAHGSPASTEVVRGPQPPQGTLLHVGDPGVPPQEDALHIPVERLWDRVGEVPEGPVALLSGYGVRAGLAVGILERAGRDVRVWQRDRRP